MKTPSFSIIIPVYNVAPYLRECLDSVLAQTFTDWEAICVDDGSTDDSGAILDEYAAKDARFKVIHQENAGVSVARKIGLGNANGDWVSFVDPDDWIESIWLSEIVEGTAIDSVDMIWVDFCIDYDNKVVISKQYCKESTEDFIKSNLQGELWGGVFNKVFNRKSILRWKVDFPNERLAAWEDWVFLLRFLSHKPTIIYKPIAGYHYRQSPQSAIRNEYSYSLFLSSVRTQMLMEDCLMGMGYADLLNRRRIEIKAASYFAKSVPDEDFYAVFPEVRSIKDYQKNIWHRIFYWFAIHGCRKYVVAIIAFLRYVKKKF